MIEQINYNLLTPEEQALAQSLQGILNRKGKRIFLDVDNYKEYLDETPIERNLWDLVNKYADDFDGFVEYDLNCNDVGINMATTISAAYDVLGVPRGLTERIKQSGIKFLADLSEVKGQGWNRQKIVFDHCYDRLNKSALVHQVVSEGNFHIALRDFAIVNRWACIYTSEKEADRNFRKDVLSRLQPNIPVYGWNDDEIAFIKDISSFGDYAVPTDWSCNHSFFGLSEGKIKQAPKRKAICEGKHFLAIVVSDGDNVQWLERDFSTTSVFGQRQASKYDYKMNWTFSPNLVKLCDKAAKKIYATAKHDYFICGVSGIGYANCLTYPLEHLDDFTRMTSEGMAQSDLSVVCLLDNINMTADNDFVTKRLHSYARFDNIAGGIWELDPDRYGSGKGKIFWADGKPFVSVRLTMWHPSGNGDNITKEWLDGFVDQINSMPVSPNSWQGYTVLNVHPWTVSQGKLDYVISKLNDNIELVYADELIDLIKANIQGEK